MTESEKHIIKNVFQNFIDVCDKYGAWNSVKEVYFDAKHWLINFNQRKRIGQLYKVQEISDMSIHYGIIVREDVDYIFIKEFKSNSNNEIFLNDKLNRFKIKDIILKEV